MVRLCLFILIFWVPWQRALASEAWDTYAKKVEAQFQDHERSANAAWNDLAKRVGQKWSDAAVPQQKVYVEYFDSDTTRVRVDYEKGSVVAETLIEAPMPVTPNAGPSPQQKIQKALSQVVAVGSKSPANILNQDEIPNFGVAGNPSLRQTLDRLVQNAKSLGLEFGQDRKGRNLYRLEFQLVPSYVKKRADRYKPLVDFWAQKYGIDPALVLGVMRQESAFNPRARSWVGAIGLMQIYPKYAGLEVFKAVKNRNEIPTDEYLYNPENNVMMGVTFLQILRDHYFADIEDREKQRLLMICAYNWSAVRLRKAIARGRLELRAPASDVFDRLTQITPDETKEYLRRVVRFTEEFRREGYSAPLKAPVLVSGG